MNVLVVDDEKNIRDSIQKLFGLEGMEVTTAADGLEGQRELLARTFDAVILDLRMPRMGGQALLEWIVAEGIRSPVVMISALGEIADAVRAIKSGADDYLIKPFDPEELIRKVRAAAENRRRDDVLEAKARTEKRLSRLLGGSRAIESIRSLIARVAPTESTVLITGESGTGKEVVAREIHAASKAASEPFVAVNIGGMHAELLESELFGHEKGAFTGADARKPGLFELAGKGSLFLDEIGDMPLPLQVKLLRVLQERRTRRLGGTRDIPIEARILSATNRDIDNLVAQGRFREDLYYRLDVVRIRIPPLRERREDIPVLAEHILAKLADRMGRLPKRASEAVTALLSGYDFPGNVRELENILERAMIYCEGEEIGVGDLDPALARTDAGAPAPTALPPATPPDARAPAVEDSSLEALEREAIRMALARCGGNRSKAALELGLSRRTIQYKIKRYGL
ncbi:sigma-54 dependent transcriptional regulator [bacterium]|nr:sigma-54 dependent transcriptional regulator [bacterium]